jgi:hypothetical protein
MDYYNKGSPSYAKPACLMFDAIQRQLFVPIKVGGCGRPGYVVAMLGIDDLGI